MRQYALLPVVAAAMSLGFGCVGGAIAKPLAFSGIRLIDGRSAEPVEDAVVIVDGDRIVAAGDRKSVV